MKFKNTSDHIEAYIKAILEQSGIVELQTWWRGLYSHWSN